jgi:transposase
MVWLPLNPADRQQLERWLDTPALPDPVRVRALIILAAAEGRSDSAIARELKVNRKTVTLWRTRYSRHGAAALWEIAAGRGRKPVYSPQQIRSLVETARPSQPNVSTPWSCRELAAKQGISRSRVSAILRQHGIASYGNSRWRKSGMLHLPQDLTAVVALYVNTPHKAIILHAGNRHALHIDGTPPSVDDEKNGGWGTQQDTLPGLDLLLHAVGSQPYESRRFRELLRFLRRVDNHFSGEVSLHLILDRLGSRSNSKLQLWLQARPRFLAHLVPPGSDWLQIVRSCLNALWEEDRVCRGVGVVGREILEYVRRGRRVPFVWMATADVLPGSWTVNAVRDKVAGQS